MHTEVKIRNAISPTDGEQEYDILVFVTATKKSKCELIVSLYNVRCYVISEIENKKLVYVNGDVNRVISADRINNQVTA